MSLSERKFFSINYCEFASLLICLICLNLFLLTHYTNYNWFTSELDESEWLDPPAPHESLEDTVAYRSLVAPIRNAMLKPINDISNSLVLETSELKNINAQPPDTISTAMLWLATVSTPDGSLINGFAQETINFLVPLSRYIRLGWVNTEDKALKEEEDMLVNEQKLSDHLLIQAIEAEALEIKKNKDPNIIILQYQPHLFKHYVKEFKEFVKEDDYIIGRSMFETDAIPDMWAENINWYLDELWVPSEFSKKVFEREGVKCKITVIGEGFDPLVFNSRRIRTDRKLHQCCKEGDFIFLGIGKNEIRKGWDYLIRAYVQTFFSWKGNAPVCLSISSHGATSPMNLYKDLEKYKEFVPSICIQPELPTDKYVAMIKSADAFILATHGEGWGRPIMEAMALGLPAIIPYWGGLTEFVTKDTALPIKVDQLEIAFKNDYQHIGGKEFVGKHHWAHLNITSISEQMLWVVKHREEAKEIGRRAEVMMRSRWTRDRVARDIRDRVAVIERDVLKPLNRLTSLHKELNLEPVATESYLKMFIEPRVQLGSMKLEAGQLEEWMSVVDEITEVNNAMLMDPTLSSKYKRLIVAAKEGIHKKLIQNQGEFMERGRTVHESYQKVQTELLMYLPFEFPLEIDPSIEEAKKDAARKEEAKKAEEEVKKIAEDIKKAAEDAKKVKEDEKKLQENPADVKKAEAKEAVEAAVAAEADNVIVLDAVIPNKALEEDKPVVAVPEEPVIKEDFKEEKRAMITTDEGKTDSLEERIAKREQLDQSNIKKLIDHKVR